MPFVELFVPRGAVPAERRKRVAASFVTTGKTTRVEAYA